MPSLSLCYHDFGRNYRTIIFISLSIIRHHLVCQGFLEMISYSSTEQLLCARHFLHTVSFSLSTSSVSWPLTPSLVNRTAQTQSIACTAGVHWDLNTFLFDLYLVLTVLHCHSSGRINTSKSFFPGEATGGKIVS